jgi:hypothetical protein
MKSRISYILIFLETKCELAIQNHHPCRIQDALSPRERIELHEALLNCESSKALGDCPEPEQFGNLLLESCFLIFFKV